MLRGSAVVFLRRADDTDSAFTYSTDGDNKWNAYGHPDNNAKCNLHDHHADSYGTISDRHAGSVGNCDRDRNFRHTDSNRAVLHADGDSTPNRDPGAWWKPYAGVLFLLFCEV